MMASAGAEFVFGKMALEGRKPFDSAAYSGGRTNKSKSKDQSPSKQPANMMSPSPRGPSPKNQANKANEPHQQRPRQPVVDTGARVDQSKDLDAPSHKATEVSDTWNSNFGKLQVRWHDQQEPKTGSGSGRPKVVKESRRSPQAGLTASVSKTAPAIRAPPPKASTTAATNTRKNGRGNKTTYADRLPAVAKGTEDLPEWEVDPRIHSEFDKYEIPPPVRVKRLPQGKGRAEVIMYQSIPDIPSHVMKMAKLARAQAREPTDLKAMSDSVQGYYSPEEVAKENERYEVMKLPLVFPDTTEEQLDKIKKRYAEAGHQLLFANRLVTGKNRNSDPNDTSLERPVSVNLLTIFAIAELRDEIMACGNLSHRDARHLSQTCRFMAVCMSQSFDCWNANKWWGGDERKLLGTPRPSGPLLITRGSSKYAGLPAERCVDQDQVDWKTINAELTEEELAVVMPINPDFPTVGPFFQNSLNTTFSILHKLTTVFRNRTCVVLPPLEIFNFGLLRILLNECPELREITVAGCAQCNLMAMENYIRLCMDFPKVKIDWTPYVWNGPSSTSRLGSFGITFNKPYFDTCAAMSAMIFRCYPFAKKIGLDLFGGSILHALKQLPFPKFWWMRLHVALDLFFDPDTIVRGEYFYYKPWKQVNEGVARAMAGDNDEVYDAYIETCGENCHWRECVLCMTSHGTSHSHLPATLNGAVPYLPGGGGESHDGGRPVVYPACLFNQQGHSDRCAKTVWESFPDNSHLRDNRGTMACQLTRSLDTPADFTVAKCLTPLRKARAMRVAEVTDAAREFTATRGMAATVSPAPDRYYLHAEAAVTEDLHRWLTPARGPWDRLLAEVQTHDPAFDLPARWRHVFPRIDTAAAGDFLHDPDHVLHVVLRLLRWRNAVREGRAPGVPDDRIHDPETAEHAARALARGGTIWIRAISAMNRRNAIRDEMRDRCEDAWGTMVQTSPTMAAPNWDLIRGQPGFEYRGPY